MTEKKITLTTDQARERVTRWVELRYEPTKYSVDIRNGVIEEMLRHFYGI